MQHTTAAVLIPIAFSLLSLSASASCACGWWGDGEMSIGSDEDAFFVPRGNEILADPAEMARLSVAYRTGAGEAQNEDLAIRWARRAAAAGHVGAMNDLGYMYEIGFAGEINEAAAVFWFRKAADQGLPAAQHSLALMLRAGRGAAIDKQAADTWLRRAAEQGHPSAAGELATLIWREEIKPLFDEEACFWWLVAMGHGMGASPQLCFTHSPNLPQKLFNELLEAAETQVVSGVDHQNGH